VETLAKVVKVVRVVRVVVILMLYEHLFLICRYRRFDVWWGILKKFANYCGFYIFSLAKKMVYVSFRFVNYGKLTSKMISLAKS